MLSYYYFNKITHYFSQTILIIALNLTQLGRHWQHRGLSYLLPGERWVEVVRMSSAVLLFLQVYYIVAEVMCKLSKLNLSNAQSGKSRLG